MFGECTELAKKRLAELLANLKDEVHERMPGLNKFSFGTMNEGCKGTEFVKRERGAMATSA